VTTSNDYPTARTSAGTRSVPVPVTGRVYSGRRRRTRLPVGVDLAAAWAERGLVLALAVYIGALVLSSLAVVVLPLVVAVLLAALLMPVVHGLVRVKVPRSVGSLLVVIAAAAACFMLLVLAGRQVATADDLSDRVVTGLEEIRTWLQTGPLKVSDTQISDATRSAQEAVASSNDRVVQGLATVTATVAHVVAGTFIALFATYFFLADGPRIWGWVVRIFPRAARERVDSSGRVAWISLTGFVRGTIVVATADALGILIIAAILDLPFLFAITVLVFIGAFVPIVGAFVSGLVAVLVALVDQGPWMALLMLLGVVAVQQLEAHVLQPFILGRFVSIHPLGVILAIAVGILLGGVAGALVAVPLVAVLNAVVVHLATPTGAPSTPRPITRGSDP
jgi:putative heme transporter